MKKTTWLQLMILAGVLTFAACSENTPTANEIERRPMRQNDICACDVGGDYDGNNSKCRGCPKGTRCTYIGYGAWECRPK